MLTFSRDFCTPRCVDRTTDCAQGQLSTLPNATVVFAKLFPRGHCLTGLFQSLAEVYTYPVSRQPSSSLDFFAKTVISRWESLHAAAPLRKALTDGVTVSSALSTRRVDSDMVSMDSGIFRLDTERDATEHECHAYPSVCSV